MIASQRDITGAQARTSRRTFLAGVGSTVSVALAGCSGGGSGNDDPTSTPTPGSDGPPFGDSLVAYYTFDERSGDTAEDVSGNGNAADVYGATRGDGRVGDSLSLDGTDDYVETPVEYADLTGGFTFEAWARNDDLSAGYGWVFTQRSPEDQWSQLGAHGDGEGRLRWELLVGEDTQATVDAPPGSIEEGTWHHWVGTWAEGEGLRLYIDAELVATSAAAENCYRGCQAANSASLSSSGGINMGAQGRDLEYWTGAFDEAKIYDRALSADEVETVYGVEGA